MVNWKDKEEVKKWQREYRQRPENKKRHREYMRKRYNNNPRIRAYHAKYRKKYNKRSDIKERERERNRERYDRMPVEVRYERTIKRLREDYKKLLLINPERAKRIKEEMERIEGKDFKELAINGLGESR